MPFALTARSSDRLLCIVVRGALQDSDAEGFEKSMTSMLTSASSPGVLFDLTEGALSKICLHRLGDLQNRTERQGRTMVTLTHRYVVGKCRSRGIRMVATAADAAAELGVAAGDLAALRRASLDSAGPTAPPSPAGPGWLVQGWHAFRYYLAKCTGQLNRRPPPAAMYAAPARSARSALGQGWDAARYYGSQLRRLFRRS